MKAPDTTFNVLLAVCAAALVVTTAARAALPKTPDRPSRAGVWSGRSAPVEEAGADHHPERQGAASRHGCDASDTRN